MAETQRANPLNTPMTASYNDPVVAVDELGREIRATRTGQRYLATDLAPSRPQATSGRGLGYNIFDNIIGYDDGVDTPGERAGAAIGAIASDPIGAARGAVGGIGGLIQRLVGGTGTMGDVIDATGLMATGGQMIAAPAGSMRVFAGRNSRTADLNALARAQELSARRRSPEEIWNETGWFKGVDNQWRYEIPDNNLSIDAPTETYFTSGLTDIPEGLIRHQALADAYPDQSYLLRTNLISDPRRMSVENSLGSFSGSDGGLIELLNRGYDETRSTAAHELQHFIQRNEGFSRGGNTINAPVVQTLLNRDLGSRVQDALMRAYNTGNSRRLEQLKSAYSDWEVDTWVNALEEYPSSSYDEISRFVDGQVVYRQPDAANRTLTAENYLNNAGEVEARTVQRRLNLTPEERAARPPWLDEPVPRDQQIIPEEYLDYNLPDQNLLTANLRGLLAR